MSPKVTISVPEDLHKKMLDLKKKLKRGFNYSRIFETAMREAIEREKVFRERLKKDPSKAKIIERLKAEKAESKENWFGKGKDDGLEWAKRAHYEEIQIVAFAEGGIFPEIPRQELNQFNPGFMSYLSDCIERIVAKAGEKPAGKISRYRETARQSWENGWVQGVKDFWLEIAREVELDSPPPPPSLKKPKK